MPRRSNGATCKEERKPPKKVSVGPGPAQWSAEQATSALIPNEGEALTRDEKLVRFVGRHGAVSVEHVMAALGVGRTAAYRRVAVCVERGLLE